MKCGYRDCNIESEISKKTGKPKKYCSKEHATLEASSIKKGIKVKRKEGLELNSVHEVTIGRNVAEEARISNEEHLNKALKGSTVARQALKTQGLTYHYRKGDGEWGEQREVI